MKKKIAKVNNMQQRAEQAVANHIALRAKAIEKQSQKKAAKVDNRQQRMEQITARFMATRDKAIERQRAKEAGGLASPNAASSKPKRRI